MNITIIEHKELVRAVSARELHEFLEVKTDFTDWCKRMLDYGFEENLDYIVFLKNEENPNSLGGRPSKEYFLTIETAKEISMLQRSEKGKEARRYFIECERKLKEKTSTSISSFDISNPTEVIRFLSEVSNVYLKQNEVIKLERDEAIKTKAWIGNKREATAMATASTMTRKVNKLEDELGKGKNFKAVTAIKGLSEYFYINKKLYHKLGILLRNLSISRGYKIIKIPHSGYRGEVNAYDVELIQEFMNEIDINPYIKDKLAEFRKY